MHRETTIRSVGSRGNLSRFQKSRNLRQDSVFKIQAKSKTVRIRRGRKGRDFWNLENLPGEGRKRKLREELQLPSDLA